MMGCRRHRITIAIVLLCAGAGAAAQTEPPKPIFNLEITWKVDGKSPGGAAEFHGVLRGRYEVVMRPATIVNAAGPAACTGNNVDYPRVLKEHRQFCMRLRYTGGGLVSGSGTYQCAHGGACPEKVIEKPATPEADPLFGSFADGTIFSNDGRLVFVNIRNQPWATADPNTGICVGRCEFVVPPIPVDSFASYQPIDADCPIKGRAGKFTECDAPHSPLHTHVKVQFNVGAPDAIIVPPDDYKTSWRPTGGKDETAAGNQITFKVVLEKKDEPNTPSAKTAKFKFELGDVSHEPGVCLNWPPKEAVGTNADLKIQPKNNPKLKVAEDLLSAESEDNLSASEVTITSYDWGAYGKLAVTATTSDDHKKLTAHLRDGKEQPTIPLDDNGNHVADTWEKTVKMDSIAATSDDDDYPTGGGLLGDGLSLYEEYRGFMIQGKHVSTDPGSKDLFIYDEDGLSAFADYFYGSNLRVHFVREEETHYEMLAWVNNRKNPWTINFNSGFAHVVDQHVLHLVDDTTSSGALGETLGGPGVPRQIREVVVNSADCLTQHSGVLALLNTVAHELSHATNVLHHGDGDYYVDVVWYQENGTWQMLMPGSPVRDSGEIAVAHGETSGVEECIMRHFKASFIEERTGSFRWVWEDDNHGNRRWVYGRPYGSYETPGSIFCETNVGTGVNDPKLPQPKTGNATRGRCFYKFRVNDR